MKKNKEPGAKEIKLSAEDWEVFERGVNYYNSGQFRHSYEAWELVWERLEKEERKFLRILMNLANSFLHYSADNDRHSLVKAMEEVKGKLAMFQPSYFGIAVNYLIDKVSCLIKRFEKIQNNGTTSAHQYEIPKIIFSRQSNPDLVVEICDILKSDQFLEGVKNFNKGYFWDAHEVWEEVWRDQTGDGKIFVESFVQMAEGYNFIKAGKLNSARYLFEKSVKGFQIFGRINCMISVPSVVDDIGSVLQQIDQHENAAKPHFKLSKNPAIILSSKN